MWTGKRFTLCAIILGTILLLAYYSQRVSQSEQDQPLEAWWVGITFKPRSTTVRGLDVRKIDDHWRYADALDSSLLEGLISPEEIEAFHRSQFSFSIRTDLDHDGVFDEFFVGIYETDEGQSGRFLAVLRNGHLIWKFQESGVAGFSALLHDEEAVQWYKCMECGSFDAIQWNGKSYVVE